MELCREHIEAAVRGGGILGGGGGGRLEEGRRFARRAFATGSPRLIQAEDLPAEAMVVTVSVVGSPSTARADLGPEDYLRPVLELETRMEKPIAGLISSENGGAATVNGWLQSAALGIPVVDAPADGRAHPTGLMGALGLERLPGYRAIQVACRGEVFLIAEGSVEGTSRLVRSASVEAGGWIAVARNPVEVRYLLEHAACGGVSLALSLGQLTLGLRPDRVATEAADRLGGKIAESGAISSVTLETEGGFDRGLVRVGKLELFFWNEYMTAEREGERLATFPDLITTIDPESGEAFTSAEARVGRRAEVLIVPQAGIPLGAGVRGREFSEAKMGRGE